MTPKYKKLSEMKRWKEAAFPIVKKIVDKYDPEVLLKMGCPEDEYDPISSDITDAINREKGFGKVSLISTSFIANIISLSFHIAFGIWGDKVRYHKYKLSYKIAKELVAELTKKRLLKK